MGVFLLLAALLLGAVAQGPFAAERTSVQALVGAASALWLVAAWLGRELDGRIVRVVVVGGALVLRAVVWTGDPRLSDDVHRYVWEGGLVAEGTSPYAHAPSDPELEAFRRRWPGTYARMNHTEVSAAYPPVAQLAFAGVVEAAGGPAADDGRRAVRAFRGAFALCDVGVLLALLALLRRRGEPAGRALVWAWSPLVALEFTGSAHLDVLGILLLVGALVAFEGARRDGRASVGYAALAMGAMVKLLPLVLVPLAVRERLSSRGAHAVAPPSGGESAVKREWTRAGLVVAGVLAASLLFVATLDGGLRGVGAGLSEYSLRWESFSLVFRSVAAPLDALVGAVGAPVDPRRVSRALVALVWLGCAWSAWRRVPERAELKDAAFVMIGAFLVLTPTLHPWYLTWIVPLLALRRSLAWMALVAAAPVLYWPLTGWQSRGEWIEPAWLWPAIALPFLALLAREWWRDRAASRIPTRTTAP